MTRLHSLKLLFTAVISSTLATAQVPPPSTQAPQPPPRGPRPAPTNLKVLPKTTTGDEVIKLMRGYTGDLGVECEFCHAQNPTTKRLDAPSDANPVKETARFMIAMTADLNDKYLADMPDRRYADPITCGTCHRGEKHPSIYVPPPRPGPGSGSAPGAPAKSPAPPPPPQ